MLNYKDNSAFGAEQPVQLRLPNGMEILLVPQRGPDVVCAAVVYRVGSRNENAGFTGSAHLLEHMLFKGTECYNEGNGGKYASLMAAIGASFNAFTCSDITAYHATVASQDMGFALHLEADRMRNALILEDAHATEMTVVRNELERNENSPATLLDQAVNATAYSRHPYHSPVIGWRSDVENTTTAYLRSFYNEFYQPNNALCLVVGNFDPAQALDIIEREFGPIPAGKPVPQIHTVEPVQTGRREVNLRAPAPSAIVEMAFHIPAALGQLDVLSDIALAERAQHPELFADAYALELLEHVLSSGMSSVFYRRFIEDQIASGFSVGNRLLRDPGVFIGRVVLRHDREPEIASRIMNEILADARKGNIDEDRIVLAKQQMLASSKKIADGVSSRASSIMMATGIGAWDFSEQQAQRIQKITKEDLVRVAELYLTEDNCTTGTHYVTKETKNFPFQNPLANPLPDIQGTSAQTSSYVVEPGSLTPRAIERENITRIVQPNGMRVLSLRGNPGTFALRAFFELERPLDAREGTLASFTASLLSQGTQKHSKLEMEHALKRLAANRGYGTSGSLAFEAACGGLAEDFPFIVEAITEELTQPAFLEEEFEKLRARSLAAITQRERDTGFRATQCFYDRIYPETHPYYIPSLDEQTAFLASLTLDDVRMWHKTNLSHANVIVAVVGDLAHAEVTKVVDSAFSYLAPAQSYSEVPSMYVKPPAGTTIDFVEIAGKSNVDTIMGSAMNFTRKSDLYYATDLANNIFGASALESRLGNEIRGRLGLTYDVRSTFLSVERVPGPWWIRFSTNPLNVQPAIDAAAQLLEEFVENGVTEEELGRAKSGAIGRFSVGVESNGALANRLRNVEYYDLGLDYMERYREIITDVTLANVNEAIKRYFRPTASSIVSAGEKAP